MKIGIVGYGNVGKGVEQAIALNPDSELFAIYTRRDPSEITPVTKGVQVLPMSALNTRAGGPDVLILCGGSATDLPEMTPALASKYTVVDSFDTHAKIPEHFSKVNKATEKNKTVAIISAGWDPGLFSLARTYMLSAIPAGKTYTFWGVGVSQGHSDAIRRIPGVADARQYTIPIDEAINSVRLGESPDLTTRQKHKRDCYVVLKDGADAEKIKNAIITMPNYFDEYDTTVTFISQQEMDQKHSEMPHGGSVIRTGLANEKGNHTSVMEFSLKLDSNPEFTGGVLLACARAAYKMKSRGMSGCYTMLDIAPADLLPLTREEILKTLV
ncbi:MAG: diaminopimelate dehydrogenase [Clostridia bacterium]|nr:diaminopimelate dehydrogenase [Clostridia bacterium]